jgi:uncharacterized protein (TIGR02145 family)
MRAEPNEGALLDLKQSQTNGSANASKGLLLPRVQLTDLNELAPMLNSSTDTEKAAYVGLTVYNVERGSCPSIPSGIYVWGGSEWTPILNDGGGGGGSDVDPAGPGEVGVLKDPRDNELYYTGDFGTAGIWMLENLRYIPKAKDCYTHSAASSTGTTDKYYAFPREVSGTTAYNDLDNIKSTWQGSTKLRKMGVLYNWAGATNGRSLPSNDEADKAYVDGYEKIQGVCPTGWYLPSDRDWNDLEQVIADAAANVYSTEAASSMTSGFRAATGFRNAPLGKKMKSTTDVNTTDIYSTNGTSKSAATGGFDALLAGNVSGSSYAFGELAYFWSSSFYGDSNAWHRSFYHSNAGVARYYCTWSALLSVRCKKD